MGRIRQAFFSLERLLLDFDKRCPNNTAVQQQGLQCGTESEGRVPLWIHQTMQSVLAAASDLLSAC